MSNNYYIILFIISSAFVLISGRHNLVKEYDPAPNKQSEPISQTCFVKSQNELEDCGDQAQKMFNVTQAQLDEKDLNVPARSFCCGYWFAIDCWDKVFKKKCNSTDLVAIKNDQAILTKIKNQGRCANYTYHSKACPEVHTITINLLSDECTDKTEDKVNACLFQASKQWNLTKNQFEHPDKNVPIDKVCCAWWDGIDCFADVVKKNCNSTDIGKFQQFQEITVKDNNAGKCSKFTYHSGECSSSSTKINSTFSIMSILFITLFFNLKRN